jgi:hypothetical protein
MIYNIIIMDIDYLLAGDIGLVAHEGDADIGRCELSRLFEPPTKVVEGVSASHVEHQQCPCSIAIVGTSLRESK